MESQRYTTTALMDVASACFVRVGVPQEDAIWTAYTLVKADLLGRATHGLSRLTAYVHAIERGKVNAQPKVRVIDTGASTVMVDGDAGLGPIAGKMAMEVAIKKAKSTGIAAVAVSNANHAGAMSIYTTLAADEGLIGFGFSNAQPAIPPWGGRRAYFGTNPISMAAGLGDAQVSVDMATSVTARGNIIMAAKQGLPIPEGWAIDSNGLPTTDPHEALQGAVLPMAGAKGYALALMVEMMAGVLTGAGVGDEVGSIYDDTNDPANTGFFFLVLDPAAFVGAEAFHDRLAKMVHDVKQSPTAIDHDEIYLPGERSRRKLLQGLEQGVTLSAETARELESLCERLGLQGVSK